MSGLDRRTLLKGAAAAATGDESFDPTLYGMSASYDAEGNYQYPDGFDPETNDWLPGHEEAQSEWERQYAEARKRFEAHMKQVEEAKKAEAEAVTEGSSTAPSTYSSETEEGASALDRDAERAEIIGRDVAPRHHAAGSLRPSRLSLYGNRGERPAARAAGCVFGPAQSRTPTPEPFSAPPIARASSWPPTIRTSVPAAPATCNRRATSGPVRP